MGTGTHKAEQLKLTDWVNEPTIADLKKNLEDAAIDHNSHQADVDRWLENMATTGNARPKKVKGKSNIVPKLIRKQAEWRYSSLSAPFLSRPDLFNIKPTTAGDKKRAQQNALILNKQFNTNIKKIKFIDDYVRDAVDIGTVIVEVGWISEEEEVTEEVPTYEFTAPQDPQIAQQLAQQYMQLLQLKQTSQDIYEQYMNPGLDKAITLFAQTGQLYQANQTGTKEVTSKKETKNCPTVEVCETANIIIDPTCSGDLNKAQFVGKKFKSSLSELKKDGRYHNLKWVVAADNDTLDNPDFKETPDVESFSFADAPRKKFVVHTYWGSWDIHNTGIVVPIVASWVGRVLIRMEENPFPFKRPPFAIAPYMPVRKSSYGEPDGELLEENQQIIGATTRGMVDLMAKSANSQTGIKSNFLDPLNKRKFVRGDDYEYNANVDPRQAVYQHTFPEIPQSAYNMVSMWNADAESLSGVKAFSSGINGQSLGNSVGGGRDALDAASKREAGILMRLADGIIEIGKMFLAMNSVWLSEKEVVRITDEQFVTVRRDDLEGAYDLELSISTPEEDEQRAKELSFMLQTTGNNMDHKLHNMILSEIARLRKMPAIAKRIEEYEPQPDPMQQKKMELELALLEAQIAKERALEAKHQSEAAANGYRGFKDGSQANLNEAKANTEMAKSRNLHSDSDQKDLNYLDQHSGTAHRQKIAEQDRAAAHALDAEVVKAQLNKDKSGESKNA